MAGAQPPAAAVCAGVPACVWCAPNGVCDDAVEISAGIGRHDVSRAQRRARILQRFLSKPVLPVVAGEWITPEAEKQAIATQVWRVLNGRAKAPGGDGTGE